MLIVPKMQNRARIEAILILAFRSFYRLFQPLIQPVHLMSLHATSESEQASKYFHIEAIIKRAGL